MKAPAVRSLRRLTVYTRSNPALQLFEGLLTICVLTCSSRGHGHTDAQCLSFCVEAGQDKRPTPVVVTGALKENAAKDETPFRSCFFFSRFCRQNNLLHSQPTRHQWGSPFSSSSSLSLTAALQNRSQPALVIIPFCVPVSASCLPVISPCPCPHALVTGRGFCKESRVLVWHGEGCRW